MTFQEFGLKAQLFKGISEIGFENPTPIQEATWEHFSSKEEDLIGLAQTGTGKTAAFSLPILNSLDHTSPNVAALVLAPTRELCLQICNDIASYSKFMVGVNVVPVYGGASIGGQIKQLQQGASIVVGTPGRTLDLINRNKLKLQELDWLVFDEADEMLSMGFKDELDAILEACPISRRTLLFSATMPREIEDMAGKYMKDPTKISTGKGANVSANNIEHKYYMVNAKDRYLALKRIADVNPDIYAIIFCRTKIGTQEVADKLGEDGYNADALHGDLTQAQRDFVMSRFRKKQIQMLVATDVAARGIDVDDLTHVIHYQLPDENEVYIHRSGRTGRAGKKGESVSIVHTREMRKLRDIERTIKKEITQDKVPTGEEICEAQLFHLVNGVHDVEVNEEIIEPYLPHIFKSFADMDKDQLIKRFISVEFNRFLEYYKDAVDINVSADRRDRNSRNDRKGGNGHDGMTKMVINHGRKSGLTPPMLINFLNELMNNNSFGIGKIRINQGNSTFWVESEAVHDLEKNLKRSKHRGISIFKDKDQSEGPSEFGSSGRRSRGGRDHRKGKRSDDDKRGRSPRRKR